MECNNRFKKKEGARIHNIAQEINENMLSIGLCGKCNEELVMYLKSSPENALNFYCSGVDKDGNVCPVVGKIDDPDIKHKFWFPIQQIVEVLADHYGEDLIKKQLEANNGN